MKKLPEVDITIVNYNGGQVIIQCLESLLSLSDDLITRIWVVDNNSYDGSVQEIEKKFTNVNLIKNKVNVGFGRAHNQVLRQVEGDYVLILNPDTLVKSGVLAELVEYLKNNDDVGAITPKIVFENGKVDLTAHRGFPTPFAAFKYYILKDDSLYHLTNRISDRPHEVDAIAGAFFMMPKKVLDKVGFFDEDYFMYAEDIDLSFRIREMGFKIIYYPNLEVLHYKGVTTGIKEHNSQTINVRKKDKQRALDSFYKTMWIFYKKHYIKKYPFFINWLVWLGIRFKWWLARRRMLV